MFPISGPPLAGGAVRIVGERLAEVSSTRSPQAIELGDVAIIPGLVNAHTHLEFSSLDEPLGTPGMEFTDWIRQVVAHRRSAEPGPAAIAKGAAECIRTGTTTIGEISTRGHFSASDLPAAGITDFAEQICLDHQRIPDVLQAARAHLDSWHPADACRPGLSPHAPYSVHRELLARLILLAVETGSPVAMHLAESPAELELLASGTGLFRTLLEEFGVWQPDAIFPSSGPLDYLRLLTHAPRSLVIHGNFLGPGEIELIAAHRDRMAVVYCPRTHAFFGHPPHPLPRLLASGARVALGTDGRSSSPDLNLLSEARFAAGRFPELAPQEFLRMATLNGAAALGLAHETGSLEPGKFADLAIVRLPADAAADPHEALLTGDMPVVATMFRGRWSWLEPGFAAAIGLPC